MERFVSGLATVSGIGMGTGSTGFDIRLFLLLSQVLLALVIFTFFYTAFALFSIARKAKSPYPWLAFVPFGNLYLIHTLANKPVWVFATVVVLIAYFLSPMVFPLPFPSIPLILAVLSCFWFAGLAARMGYHPLFGAFVPVFVYLSIASLSNGFRFVPLSSSASLIPLLLVPFILWSAGMALLGIIAWRTIAQPEQ